MASMIARWYGAFSVCHRPGSALDSADEVLKSDAKILFEQFQALIDMTRLIDKEYKRLYAVKNSRLKKYIESKG